MTRTSVCALHPEEFSKIFQRSIIRSNGNVIITSYPSSRSGDGKKGSNQRQVTPSHSR